MKTNSKILLSVVLLVGGLGTFLYLKVTRPQQPPAKVEERVWRVAIRPVIPRSLAPVLTLYGQVETPDLLKAAAPADAVVQTVRVKEGDEVQRGQLLIRLDPRDFRPRVDQARADVAELEARIASERLRYQSDLASLEKEREIVRLSRASVVRAQRLKKENLGSSSALDEAREAAARQALQVTAREFSVQEHEARLSQLEAGLLRAQARLEAAQLDQQRSELRAPFDGIVAGVDVAMGDRVKRGQVMLRLYARKALEVRARIPAPYQEELQRAVARDEPVKAVMGLDGSRIELRLNRFSGEADPSGIDGLFDIQGDPAWLRMGEMMEFRLQRPLHDHVFPIPYQALYGGNRIYLLEDGRMQARTIETVGSFMTPGGEEWLLVRGEGIRQGDQVVVTHLPNAMTGLRVEVVP